MLQKSLKICQQKLTKMVPKWVPKPFQNWSCRGSGGHLGATIKARCFQDLTFDDFGANLGPPLGPVWAHFRHHVFVVFLTFWWLWPPFGLPKHIQNETQKGAKDTSYQKTKIELSQQPELNPEGCGGPENHNLFNVFLEPHFGMAFGTHFNDFVSLWVSFGLHVGHF